MKGFVNSFACITRIGQDELKLATVIGCGAFGQVYKAVWRGSTVATKAIAVAANPKELDNKINVCKYVHCTLTCSITNTQTLNFVYFPGLWIIQTSWVFWVLCINLDQWPSSPILWKEIAYMPCYLTWRRERKLVSTYTNSTLVAQYRDCHSYN